MLLQFRVHVVVCVFVFGPPWAGVLRQLQKTHSRRRQGGKIARNGMRQECVFVMGILTSSFTHLFPVLRLHRDGAAVVGQGPLAFCPLRVSSQVDKGIIFDMPVWFVSCVIARSVVGPQYRLCVVTQPAVGEGRGQVPHMSAVGEWRAHTCSSSACASHHTGRHTDRERDRQNCMHTHSNTYIHKYTRTNTPTNRKMQRQEMSNGR